MKDWLYKWLEKFWEWLVKLAKDLVPWLLDMLKAFWDWLKTWADPLLQEAFNKIQELLPKDWMPDFGGLSSLMSFASWLFELEFALKLVMAYITYCGGMYVFRMVKSFIVGTA